MRSARRSALPRLRAAIEVGLAQHRVRAAAIAVTGIAPVFQPVMRASRSLRPIAKPARRPAMP